MSQLAVDQALPLTNSTNHNRHADQHLRKSSTTRSHLRLPHEQQVHLPLLTAAHSYIRIPSTTTLHANASRKLIDTQLIPQTTVRSPLASYNTRHTSSSKQLQQQFRRVTAPTLPALNSPRRNKNEPLPSIQLQQIVCKLEALAAQQTAPAPPAVPVATATAHHCLNALQLMQQMMDSKEDKQA